MLNKESAVSQLIDIDLDQEQISQPPRRLSASLLWCLVVFVLCALLSVTPLVRLPDAVVRLDIAPGAWLGVLSSWLPTGASAQAVLLSSYGELLVLLMLATSCYVWAALWIRRQPATELAQRWARRCLWTGAILVGLVYVVTPAMLSHDILVYASYGRVLSAHQANPYFVPISDFPADPFTPLDYWAHSVSAYGPIWTALCGLCGWFLGAQPVPYVLTFRLFALAMHLLNTWLIGRILRLSGRSGRIATLGMLLYAWNPLLLLESGLGGHNDGLMLTFVLLGILLAVRAEKYEQLHRVRGYLPPTIALTLAALVKFTALPILAVYLLLLAAKTARMYWPSTMRIALILRGIVRVCLALLCALLMALALALLAYGPFWLGHSPHAILSSFNSPPEARGAENSFMRSITDWERFHPTWKTAGLLIFLSTRANWNTFNYELITLCLLLSVWRLWLRPTVRAWVICSLSMLSLVLLVTPWFFSWYITWIIGLALSCLPMHHKRLEAALLALTLTFSFSSLITYVFNTGLAGEQSYLVSLCITAPPVCAFLLILLVWRTINRRWIGKAR
jgi:hypothetical protein